METAVRVCSLIAGEDRVFHLAWQAIIGANVEDRAASPGLIIVEVAIGQVEGGRMTRNGAAGIG